MYCNEWLDALFSLVEKKNKYCHWYYSLCLKAVCRAQNRKDAKTILGYVEGHHVLPKSFKMGGERNRLENRNNFVYFSAREHFVAHLLLIKMNLPEPLHLKMVFAAYKMLTHYKINSHMYQHLQKANSQAISLRGKKRFSKPDEVERHRQAQLASYRHNPDRARNHSRNMKQRFINDPSLATQIGLATSQRNKERPAIQTQRRKTIANKARVTCSACNKQFRYLNNVPRHKCYVPDYKRSEISKNTLRTHPEMTTHRLHLIANLPGVLCTHCNKTFKYLNKWRKHTGCQGNPAPNIECKGCNQMYTPLTGRKFCSKRCATVYNNQHRVLKKNQPIPSQ